MLGEHPDHPLVMLRSALVLSALLALSACQPATPAGPVTESGTLELGDLTLGSGEYYDLHTVSMDEGEWLKVSVSSTEFDPYLIVRTPSGAQSEIDDPEDGNTEYVETVVRASESGSWDIGVTSFEPGETGASEVTYEVTAESPAGASSTETPAEESVEDADEDAVEV